MKELANDYSVKDAIMENLIIVLIILLGGVSIICK